MTTNICFETDSKLQQGFPSSPGAFPDGCFPTSALQLATLVKVISPFLNAKLRSRVLMEMKGNVSCYPSCQSEEMYFWPSRATACVQLQLVALLQHPV